MDSIEKQLKQIKKGTKMALKKHALIISVFSVSSLVVFMLASQDLRYVQINQAREKITIRTEETEAEGGGIGTIGSVNETPEQTEPENEQLVGSETEEQTSGGYTAGVSKAELFAPNIAAVDAYLEENNIGNNFAVAFIDLKYSDTYYYHNEEATFRPASIYKVPLSMLVLKKVEDGEVDLNDLAWKDGKQKSLKEIMELMIIESDNDGMSIFESQLGGYVATQNLMLQDLGVQVRRIDQVTNAKDIETVFRQLYDTGDSAYLNKESRDYLIDLMANASSNNRDRIPRATDQFNQENNTSLTAATKIGNLTGIYEDAGFIFGENSDYVLVILNKNLLNNSDGIEHIGNITKLLLKDLE